jgi:hypothetical protein
MCRCQALARAPAFEDDRNKNRFGEPARFATFEVAGDRSPHLANSPKRLSELVRFASPFGDTLTLANVRERSRPLAWG